MISSCRIKINTIIQFRLSCQSLKKMKNQISHITEFYKEEPKHLAPIVVLIITILILFFGLPNEILYAKNGILKWLPFIIIFGFIPWLISKTLNPHKIRKDYMRGIYCAAILILGPSFGIWSGVQSKNDLELNGELTKGVIYEKWFSNKKSEDEWLLKCYFQYEGKKYSTFSQEDVYNQFQLGDSLEIKFSKNFPDNNRIIGLNKKLKTN